MSAETTIRELMHDADNLMAADEPVKNARKQFELETARSLILVDGTGPIGLLTRSRMRQISDSEMGLPARDFAVHVPVLHVSQSLADARQHLGSAEFDANRIPVVNDDGRFVGVIDRDVVMRQAETVETDSGTLVVSNNGSDQRYSLEVGMTVKGSDDNKLGKVNAITQERDHVTSFLVEHGLFGRHHKRIAAEHVAKVEDDAVFIDFGKTEFGFLSDIEEIEEDATPMAAS